MKVAYGLPKATVECYRLLVSLGMHHDKAMQQLKAYYMSSRVIAGVE